MLRILNPEFARFRVRRIWAIAGLLLAVLFWGSAVSAALKVGSSMRSGLPNFALPTGRCPP
jgi:hypothetical protein